MDNSIFLSSEKLDTLTNRVTKKIEFLKHMDRSGMWDMPITYCKKIDQSVMAVDTVVLEVMKEKGHYMTSSSNPYNYQMMMARIYILLYYRYHDKPLYNSIVFPAIMEHMGVFREKYLNDIHSRIDEILKFDELVKKATHDSREEMKPRFHYEKLNKGQSDELYDEYNEEKLFRNLTPEVERCAKRNFGTVDVAEIWYNAKNTVRNLWQVKYPEKYIKRILNDQDIQFGQSDAAKPQLMMMCVYAMMRSVRNSDHFKEAIADIEFFSSPYNYDGVGSILRDEMKRWKKMIDEQNPFDDYDYVGETPSKDTFTTADVVRLQENFEKRLSDLNAQLKEKDDKISKLQEEKTKLMTEENQSDGTGEVKMPQKVRLDLLLRLIEKDGADLDKHGNKTKAAEIMHDITGLPISTCKNYCTNKDLNTKEHEEIILKLNSKLQALGMNIRL